MTDDRPPSQLSPSERPTAPPGGRESNDADRVSLEPDGHASTMPPPASVASVRIRDIVGETLHDRYIVESILGEGGMGVVYRGRHKLINKPVAIKVLRGEMARDKEVTDRFLQEAQAASAIGSPHIINISDYGRLDDGLAYFVMEQLDGSNLTQVMARTRPLPTERLCRIAVQIAEGLDAAHAAKIVHRDLKPDNVMLITHGSQRDFVKILDFGIAKVGAGSINRMTQKGSIFGTPHYMSPEQAAGSEVDHRTDIYSLGVMLYEMASGRVPFDADNYMGILTQHMYKAPKPLTDPDLKLNVPIGLDAIVLKCMAKKPEARFQTMHELAEDLRRLLSGLVPDSVQDLANRSGSHAAAPDYFAERSVPALATTGRQDSSRQEVSPKDPAAQAIVVIPRSRIPLYVALAATFATLIATLFELAAQAPAPASAPPAEIVAAPVAPAPAPTVVTPPPPPAPAKQEVLLSVIPPDATITRDGRDLGTSPVALHLGESEIATLVVSRPGYRPESVSLRAGDAKRTVRLHVNPGERDLAKPPAAVSRSSTGHAQPDSAPHPAPVRSKVQDDVGDPFTGH